MCVNQVVRRNARPQVTQTTLACLADPDLGPVALTPGAQTHLLRNTTDFRYYVEETTPRTNTC